MRIAIDNLDGNGARDYTAALSAAQPLKIVRTRNQAARAFGMLDLNATALPAPVRYARVTVTNDAGATLFAGSLNTAPGRVYAGVDTRGGVYTLAFAATADKADAAEGLLREDALTHTLNDGDAVVAFAAPSASAARELAADLTLSGLMEPAAYIAESFLGDGTTAVFDLTEPPFRPAGTATVLDERFERDLNPRLWQVNDAGGFLSLTSAGLTMTGGNGLDGQTTLTAIAPLEIAGTLMLVADGVVLHDASDGVLCGLYTGDAVRNACMAGFNVRQSSGTTVVTPLVNGSEAGSSLTVLSGHRYRLRLRLHCPESVRFGATYTAVADGALRSFGGDAVAAPVTLLFEAQDLGLSSNTPATVLYTTTIVSSSATCSFAPVNSVQLIGSIAGIAVTQQGSAWITTTASDGTVTVRMAGEAGDGVDCTLSTQGRITFFSGRVPLPGEVITVRYRSRQRAVARVADAAAVTAHAASGLPATARWQGKVAGARTSMDCENAAQAALAFAGSRAATVGGHCTLANPAADIRPGDLLALVSGGDGDGNGEGDTLRVLARSVEITGGEAVPGVVTYRIAFANDWAACLDAPLAEGVADDALLPAAAQTAVVATPGNLPALAVISATGDALVVDAGTAPPAGGGFEVRRRDWEFGPGTGGDLVLRSAVRGFTIPRSAQVERFFVRMYDGANPPAYSRFSSAIFTSLPVGE